MLKLFITRHGETEWNVENRFHGRLDAPLTQKGKECALALGRSLLDIPFDRVYSSSTKRALDTANLICNNRNQKIIAEDLLMEIDLGAWDGELVNDVKENDKKEFNNFWNAPTLFSPKGGESLAELRERAAQVLKKITSHHLEGNILIVTHSALLKAMLTVVKNLPVSEIWSGSFPPGTSLTILEYNKGAFSVIKEGDISHLS